MATVIDRRCSRMHFASGNASTGWHKSVKKCFRFSTPTSLEMPKLAVFGGKPAKFSHQPAGRAQKTSYLEQKTFTSVQNETFLDQKTFLMGQKTSCLIQKTFTLVHNETSLVQKTFIMEQSKTYIHPNPCRHHIALLQIHGFGTCLSPTQIPAL
jgi:hypothetical protein